jgi:hypothetical protein
MFAEFIRFYGYTAEQALGEYAKRFFALCNSMYRIAGKESLELLVINSNAMSGGDDASRLADNLKKQAKGNHAILQEVKVIKG